VLRSPAQALTLSIHDLLRLSGEPLAGVPPDRQSEPASKDHPAKEAADAEVAIKEKANDSP
jgi:hypothetical protein